jgi:hypothetical protein
VEDDNEQRPQVIEGDAESLRYWADVFGVSVDELRLAVAVVGPDCERLGAYLKGP